MRIALLTTASLLLLGVQACSQAGETMRPRQESGSTSSAPGPKPCDTSKDPDCGRRAEPGALKPAVPPDPDSPIRAKCAELPTQVERDTCINRKASTG